MTDYIKNNWKAYVQIGLLIINLIIFASMKFTDLNHLTEQVEKICNKVEFIEQREYEFNGRLSKVEAQINKQFAER